MSNEVLKAVVKSDGRPVMVYKLQDGRYNLFLGETITEEKIKSKEHMTTFSASELEFK